MSGISQAERRWALRFALAVMAVTMLPYLAGYAVAGAEWRFTGFVLGVEDGHSYLGKMLSGAAGAWLFRTPYTAVEQGGALAFLPYILLGKLTAGAGQHEQLVALFHLFRFGAGTLAILAMYEFVAFFVQETRWRRWGVALAACGGGLGWALLALGRDQWWGSLPLDFYSPETFGFLALFGLPHLAAARALMLWGLLMYLRPPISAPASSAPSFRWWLDVRADGWAGLKIGGMWLLMGLMNPLSIVTTGAALAAHLLILGVRLRWGPPRAGGAGWGGWRALARRGLWAGVMPGALAVYTLLAFSADPFLRQWTAQNRILSPHPAHYAAAYGLLILFAIAGARRLLRKSPLAGWLPVVWVAILPLLAYAPHNLQRRLPEGVWVALVILAMAYFDRKAPLQNSKFKIRNLLFTIPLFLAFPTTILILAGSLLTASRTQQPLFRSAAEVAAFQYLNTHAQPGDVVLTAFETGNALPAWAPVRVVIGHGPESVGLDELRPRVAAFYQPATPAAERLALLDEFGVGYVFWGEAERALGGWDPAKAEYLQLVYAEEGYAIFELGGR